MNRYDKEILRLIIITIIGIVTAYYTVKHFDRIDLILTNIIRDIKSLF